MREVGPRYQTTITMSNVIRSDHALSKHGVSTIVQSTFSNCVLNSGQNANGNPVSELVSLLGNEALLIPVRTGSKAPLLDGWTNIRVGMMQNSEYLEQLTRGNIGVSLGIASNGLCAVDVDDDDLVEPFLALNPALRNTLITKGKKGAQIWVKICGQYPSSKKIKDEFGSDVGEWRADGNQSVIYGVHPEGMNYRRLNNVTPLVVAFDEIQWPEDWSLPWVKTDYDKLVEEHMEPYFIGSAGALTFNEFFFIGRFLLEHPVIWEPKEEEFYQYHVGNGLWLPVSSEVLVKDFGYDLKRAGDDVGNKRFALKRTGILLNSWVKTMKGMVEKADVFKVGNRVIHLGNGMLDLRHMPPKLMTFHPDYFSRNICPIAFDPLAQCPRFTSELLGSALDAADIDLLQRWSGSVLLGGNQAQRILLLIGTPNGGKSTLIEIIEKVIGLQNVAEIRTKHLDKQFEFFKFIGKTLLTGKDVGAEFLSEEGVGHLKALVGNDLLDAEKKGSSSHFQLRGNFNVAITSNSDLHVKLEGDTGAWERRMMVLEYNRPAPTQKIVGFGDKLIAEEGPGILNWMIEGAIKHLHELQETGNFHLTVEQKDRVKALLDQSDSVRLFVRNCVNPENGHNVTTRQLEASYYGYCRRMNWRPIASRDFTRSIAGLMREIHHVSEAHDISHGMSSQRGFRNVVIGGEV